MFVSMKETLGTVNKGHEKIKLLPNQLNQLSAATSDEEILRTAKMLRDVQVQVGVKWDQLIKLGHYKYVLQRYLVGMSGFPGVLQEFFDIMNANPSFDDDQRDFIRSVEDQWQSKAKISERQAVALAGMYFNELAGQSE